MKRHWIPGVLGLMLANAAVAGAPAVDGQYVGVGRWRDADGGTGAYGVSARVKDGAVATDYDFDGHARAFEFKMAETAPGFFDVQAYGQVLGTGHCMSTQCHYAIRFGETEMEETLTFYEGHLYKLGSKMMDGKKVIWEENLDVQAAK